MYFSQSKSQFVCRSVIRVAFSDVTEWRLYKFLYARSLRWQSDHFRKLCSVHRGFIGAMTFNFDMTIWHNISIARGCLTFMQYKYYLILEEKSYIFEGMLIKIVIWTFEYFYICIKWTWYTDSLFLIHLYKHSNSISSRCIFWCVFVAIIWSNQIKRGRLYYVFQKSSELWTGCTCTKLARDVWTRYILYLILYTSEVWSRLAGQSLTLIIKLYTENVKRSSQQGIVYQILQIYRLYVN
jgi:hypothetical protein